MPPKRNTKKQQQQETVEIVECKINNFINGSKSDDDDISDDDTVNIYVDSVRNKQKLKETPTVKPIQDIQPIVPKLKRIPRGKTARIEPTVNPPQQDGDPAIDYFKMCNEYKEQLEELTKKQAAEKDKSEPKITTNKAVNQFVGKKKSELDLRRESFVLKFG